jgi:hypothetical protein
MACPLEYGAKMSEVLRLRALLLLEQGNTQAARTLALSRSWREHEAGALSPRSLVIVGHQDSAPG